MAKKTRKKSAAKSKKGKKSRKKASVGARKRRKSAVKKTARKKAAPRKKRPHAKPKGFVAKIVGAATAVVDTLTDAERLHHKLEPHVPRDPE